MSANDQQLTEGKRTHFLLEQLFLTLSLIKTAQIEPLYKKAHEIGIAVGDLETLMDMANKEMLRLEDKHPALRPKRLTDMPMVLATWRRGEELAASAQEYIDRTEDVE